MLPRILSIASLLALWLILAAVFPPTIVPGPVAVFKAMGENLASGQAFYHLYKTLLRYFWYGPDQSELEIGWTFLARSHWGGVYNGEMKRLMLDYAFKFVDRVIFLVGTINFRSQKAMKKIGGILTERRVQRSLHGNFFEFVIFEIKRTSTP